MVVWSTSCLLSFWMPQGREGVIHMVPTWSRAPHCYIWQHKSTIIYRWHFGKGAQELCHGVSVNAPLPLLGIKPHCQSPDPLENSHGYTSTQKTKSLCPLPLPPSAVALTSIIMKCLQKLMMNTCLSQVTSDIYDLDMACQAVKRIKVQTLH